MTTDIVILDTECLGLHSDAPVWEFAGVRVDADGGNDTRLEMRIKHTIGDWLDDMPERFLDDYLDRYNPDDATDEYSAAILIHIFTANAIVVGCNPGFDIERLTKLLQRNGLEPKWHYHPLDIASLAIGFLAGRGYPPEQPWKSDHLADAIGVTAADYRRHTAMGDVEWTYAQWRNIMGNPAGTRTVMAHGDVPAREIFQQYPGVTCS
jgi:hypothetical protein